MKYMLLLVGGMTWMLTPQAAVSAPIKPNVVIILADDLGYGDVGCYGATHIKTPNIDRLAREGMRFTQAYTPGSVCSPTRYALLSGRYVWRSEKHHDMGVHAPGAVLMFEKERMTLASLFKRQGYTTGCIGKWHLGFGEGDNPSLRYDWGVEEIKPGPCEIGFDYFYGLAANAGNAPRIYIENHRFVGRKPGDKVEMVGRAEIKPWNPDVEWKDERVAGDMARKAVEFIQRSKDKPFFLYFPSTIAHNPITPAPEDVGRSSCGLYGDFVQELDKHVGWVLDALTQAGVLDQTLILFTSDNGGVVADNDRLIEQWRAKQAGHAICGALRGRKHSVYEGGFRVPFIVRWPGVTKPGTVNTHVIGLVDMLATMADMLGVALPAKMAGEDSFSVLATIRGDGTAPTSRESVIMKSANGVYAIRRGRWKLIEQRIFEPLPPPKPGKPAPKAPRPNPENENQLYDLEKDPSESVNVWAQHPEIVEQLLEELRRARKETHTRSGAL